MTDNFCASDNEEHLEAMAGCNSPDEAALEWVQQYGPEIGATIWAGWDMEVDRFRLRLEDLEWVWLENQAEDFYECSYERAQDNRQKLTEWYAKNQKKLDALAVSATKALGLGNSGALMKTREYRVIGTEDDPAVEFVGGDEWDCQNVREMTVLK